MAESLWGHSDFPADDGEDLTQYPDAIDDENRHRAPEVGEPGRDDVDLWQPTDDVDVIEDATEDRLRWRIVRPDKSVAASDETTRTNALSRLGNFLNAETMAKLDALNHTVAGWCAISADGWTIEPQPVPTDG